MDRPLQVGKLIWRYVYLIQPVEPLPSWKGQHLLKQTLFFPHTASANTVICGFIEGLIHCCDIPKSSSSNIGIHFPVNETWWFSHAVALLFLQCPLHLFPKSVLVIYFWIMYCHKVDMTKSRDDSLQTFYYSWHQVFSNVILVYRESTILYHVFSYLYLETRLQVIRILLVEISTPNCD